VYESESEKNRDIKTTRTVSIFHNNKGIAKKCQRVKKVIKVEKNGIIGTQIYHFLVYYISSLVLDAILFAAGIRGHWTSFYSPISQLNAATNLSILTTIAINLLRSNGSCELKM